MIETAWAYVQSFWGVLGQMAPYLLLGFLVAGILSVAISPAAVERHLGGGGLTPVVKAALFGIPLPLCSCGAIPVAASLRRHGASKGATVGFLLSTPQTGADSIMVTLSLLGPVFAVFRPLVALATGLIGGAAVAALDKEADRGSGAGTDSAAAPPADGGPKCDGECCEGDRGRSRFFRVFRYGFVTLPRDIGKPLLVGLAVAGAITVLVPPHFFGPILGKGLTGMLAMMAVGIPAYVCATGSVPVAAALIAKGVSPGAALVFLITGPATNAAAIAMMWKVLGRRSTVIYLVVLAAAGLAAGAALDWLFTVPWVGEGACHPAGSLPAWANDAGAAILLAVLAFAMPRPSPGRHGPEARGEEEMLTKLRISGMTCSRCAEGVRRALLACRGVTSVEVDLKTGTATISGNGMDAAALELAVMGLGYEVIERSKVETRV